MIVDKNNDDDDATNATAKQTHTKYKFNFHEHLYRKSVHMHHKAKNEKRISHQVYVLVYVKNTFKEGVQQTPRTFYNGRRRRMCMRKRVKCMLNGNWGNV